MKSKKMSFSVENIEEVKRDIDKTQFSLLKVDAFSTQPSLHETYVTEETLKKSAKTILLKPFVFVVDEKFDDIGSHDKKEVPGGFVPHDSPLIFYKDSKGYTRFSCEVLVWKRYSGKLLDYFERDGGKKGVSVEIEVYGDREDYSKNLLEITDYSYSAITCLGDFITPAIENAQAVMAFSKEYNKAYQMEFGKYEDLDFKIPAAVKKNAKQGLELREKYGRGGTSVGLGTARYLIKNDVASPEKVRHIAKYFPRHAATDNLDDKESNGWISWLNWGGDAGRKWSTALVKKMDELDSKEMSYFSKEDNMNNIDFSLTSAQILEILSACLTDTYLVGDNEYRRNWVETYDDECVYIYDNKDNCTYCASYVLNRDTKTATINLEQKHRVIRGGYEVVDENGNALFASERGTGESLEVDKSKESLSTDAWGDVDKTSLRNDVLKAKNYKSLVKDVYMIVESGWEEHPSSSLKYPVMQKKGNKLVYNRYGLSAALQRAKGQSEESVVKKVLSLYKKLEIDEKEETESMKPKQEMEMESPEAEETPKEEQEETPAEETKEVESGKEKFSLNAWADTSAMLAFLEEETEDASEEGQKVRLAADELKKGDEADMSAVMSGMYAKMCKMSTALKASMAENEELKKFKGAVEEEQKTFAVDTTIKELSEKFVIPEEVIQEMKTKSSEYAFSAINDWKNIVKAQAVDFAVRATNTEDDEEQITRFALPFNSSKRATDDVWASTN